MGVCSRNDRSGVSLELSEFGPISAEFGHWNGACAQSAGDRVGRLVLMRAFAFPASADACLLDRYLQSFGEELQRLLRFRFLLAGEVDVPLRQERPRFGTDLERLGGRALRR